MFVRVAAVNTSLNILPVLCRGALLESAQTEHPELPLIGKPQPPSTLAVVLRRLVLNMCIVIESNYNLNVVSNR